ncbi:unnamed protein product [Camellia sinensis]
MTKSENFTFEYFSGILCRLLCTGNLPTHPSDLITDSTTTIPTTTFENSKNDFKTQVKTPGVVARLMGLDSLPTSTWFQKTPPFSVADQSITLITCQISIPLFPTIAGSEHHYRFVKFQLFSNNNNNQKSIILIFFVLCLEKVGGNGGIKMGLSSDMALKDLKQKEMKTERNRENLSETKFENKRMVFRRKEDQPNRLCGNCSSKVDNVNLDRKNKVVVNVNQKKTGSELKIGNNKKSRNNIAKKVQQSVCVSKNLSPVSVLDLHHHSLSLHHESTSGHTNVTISNSRSSNVTDNDNNPSSNYTRNFIADEHHVIKETHWVNEKVIEFEDFEEICTVFGQQILDLTSPM